MPPVEWNAKKTDEGGTTNAARAERAYRVTLHYKQYKDDGSDMEEYIGDLMADLLHLCAESGLDPEQMRDRAWMHFEEER